VPEKVDLVEKCGVAELDLTVDQVRGQVVQLMKTYAGSLMIQGKLDQDGFVAAWLPVLLAEIKDNMTELVLDYFARFAVGMRIYIYTSSFHPDRAFLFVSCFHAQKKLLPDAPRTNVWSC
jgi:hypothetical protein